MRGLNTSKSKIMKLSKILGEAIVPPKDADLKNLFLNGPVVICPKSNI